MIQESLVFFYEPGPFNFFSQNMIFFHIAKIITDWYSSTWDPRLPRLQNVRRFTFVLVAILDEIIALNNQTYFVNFYLLKRRSGQELLWKNMINFLHCTIHQYLEGPNRVLIFLHWIRVLLRQDGNPSLTRIKVAGRPSVGPVCRKIKVRTHAIFPQCNALALLCPFPIRLYLT